MERMQGILNMELCSSNNQLPVEIAAKWKLKPYLTQKVMKLVIQKRVGVGVGALKNSSKKISLLHSF